MSLNSSNTPEAASTPSLANAQPDVTQPADTPPKAPRRGKFWPSFGKSAGYIGWTFAGFMLAQLIVLGFLMLLQAANVDIGMFNKIMFNTVANIIVYILALTILIGLPWLVFKQKTSLKDLGLQRLPQGKDFLWLIAGIVAYVFLTLIITSASRMLFPGADYDQVQDTGFSGLTSRPELILTFISLVIVAPLAEETMFRGYLFGKLKKHAKVWVSVILSALLFAVVHFQFNVGLDTFALGVVLALLRVATGSIWASIMLHMVKNGLAFYVLFISGFTL